MKVGLIGYGYWGRGFVARNIARVAELAVIVDPDPERIAEASTVWSAWGTRVATEPEVAFAECDAVWIATPAATHEDLVRRALSHGVHVLCEKPFVFDPDEASSLCEQADSDDLALLVGHLSLYTEAHTQASLVPTRRIETVRHTTAPSLSDANVVWGLAPHDVASVLALFGTPESVFCRGTDHRAIASLQWRDGREATIEVDWLADERRRVHRVFGAKGFVDVALADNKVEPLLAQASHFVALCEADSEEARREKRAEAEAVTVVLAAMEQCRTKVAV